MQRNRILNAMSNADFGLIKPHLETVELKFRQRLQASNRRIDVVYFLTSGLASVVAIGGKGRQQAEVAVIGWEGMTGLPVLLDAERSPCEVFMQIEGDGFGIAAESLDRVMGISQSLSRCLLRSAHVFSVQAHYTALANARGNIAERLARWLLMARDRCRDDELLLTHEFLALMLGVRRAGVTVALQEFENKALISTARGRVTIVDRAGLEEHANGLYGYPESELERLFPR